jgi:isopenicillin N synthase-like dioxygenase
MPGPVVPLGSYHHVPETQFPLDWADLVTIDLSRFHDSAERPKLASQLFKAVQTHGFFYVKGFDISQERVDRQFAIGKNFYELPLEEKLKYVPDLDMWIHALATDTTGSLISL